MLFRSVVIIVSAERPRGGHIVLIDQKARWDMMEVVLGAQRARVECKKAGRGGRVEKEQGPTQHLTQEGQRARPYNIISDTQRANAGVFGPKREAARRHAGRWGCWDTVQSWSLAAPRTLAASECRPQCLHNLAGVLKLELNAAVVADAIRGSVRIYRRACQAGPKSVESQAGSWRLASDEMRSRL